MKIESPLTGRSNVKHEQDITTSFIKEKYLEKFNIDVSPYFHSIDKVSIFIDQDTDYRFYYPYTVAGNDKFYEDLQEYEWYYMPWKWEHKKCAEMVCSGDKVLEIGCAKGDFLHKLEDLKDVHAVGLELNESAARLGQENGLDIRCEFVEEHAKNFPDTYDVVCSFQVLEHISAVGSFIKANIDCVKKGGKIIFCVPNNEAFTKYDWENDILNMPPHHMGLWNKKAFKKLASLFNIQLLNIYYEPLQPYHHHFYIKVLEKRISRYKLLKQLYNRFKLQRLLGIAIQKSSKIIHGHSIMAVYIK